MPDPFRNLRMFWPIRLCAWKDDTRGTQSERSNGIHKRPAYEAVSLSEQNVFLAFFPPFPHYQRVGELPTPNLLTGCGSLVRPFAQKETKIMKLVPILAAALTISFQPALHGQTQSTNDLPFVQA